MIAADTLEPLSAFSHSPIEPRPQPIRDALILKHLPAVHLIARRIQKHLPASVVLEDLISAGTIGLISAVDHYDPARGVKLGTYAEYKIRGAILDSLRTADWATRPARRRFKQVEHAIDAAERRWNRSPTEEEIAAELGESVEVLRKWRAESRTLAMGEFEFRSWNEEEQQARLRALPATGESPLERVERIELMRKLLTTIDLLPTREGIVLKLHFLQDKPLQDVAEILGFHPSRISQLKMRALRRLREDFASGVLGNQFSWSRAGAPHASAVSGRATG